MKSLSSTASIILLALVITASGQTQPPAQNPTAPGQTPPGQGQPTQAPAAPQRRAQPRSATMQIVVRDLSGSPIADARITVSGGTSRQATTDSKGVATLASMRDGTYRLRFERDGFVTFEREITLRGGQPSETEVVLNMAPPPPPPPQPETPPPPPPPPQPIEATGSPVSLSIPAFLDRNFIGRDPLKESTLGCTSAAMARLLQIRDSVAVHTHSELDEILYVVAGEGTVRIREESNPVSAGSLTVIPRGVPHSIDRRGKNPLIILSTLAGTPVGPNGQHGPIAPCEPSPTTLSGRK